MGKIKLRSQFIPSRSLRAHRSLLTHHWINSPRLIIHQFEFHLDIEFPGYRIHHWMSCVCLNGLSPFSIAGFLTRAVVGNTGGAGRSGRLGVPSGARSRCSKLFSDLSMISWVVLLISLMFRYFFYDVLLVKVDFIDFLYLSIVFYKVNWSFTSMFPRCSVVVFQHGI